MGNSKNNCLIINCYASFHSSVLLRVFEFLITFTHRRFFAKHDIFIAFSVPCYKIRLYDKEQFKISEEKIYNAIKYVCN